MFKVWRPHYHLWSLMTPLSSLNLVTQFKPLILMTPLSCFNSTFILVLCCMLYTASVDCIVKLDCMFVIARQAVWHCMYISIWYGPRVNLIYVTSTKLLHTTFMSQTCHNSTKKVLFSFSRPQARSSNIGQIPVERRQCCLLFSLHSWRLQNIIANSYFIWMLYKDMHLPFYRM